MIKTIKKLWMLFEKTLVCSQKTDPSVSCSLRVPLVYGRLDSFTNEGLSIDFFVKKIKDFLPYTPIAFVSLAYFLSIVLILFFLNLPLITCVVLLTVIMISGIRHLACCYWSLNVCEIGFDSGFYSVDRQGEKNIYTLQSPCIVTPFMVVLNFSMAGGDRRVDDSKSCLSYFNRIKILYYLQSFLVNFIKTPSRALVVTRCSIESEDFRRLRVFLLALKKAS